MKIRNSSLQTRLILLAAASVAIALVTTCVGFMSASLSMLHTAKCQQLRAQAEIVAFNSAAALLLNDSRAGEQLLAPLEAQPSIDAAAIYDDDGKLLASYARSGADAAPATAPKSFGGFRSTAGGHEYVQQVAEGGESVGTLYLRANVQDLWKQFWQQMLVASIVVAATLAATLPLAYALARAISRPILELARTAGHITQHGDFSVRVSSKLENEIGELYRAFNEMVEHVETSDRALKASQDELEDRVEKRTAELQQEIVQRERVQRDLVVAKDAAEAASKAKSEFLANMSHEIRTPMNGVLGLTELVLDTDLSRDQRESMEMVKSSAEALMVVINDILDFSKIEAGKLELDPTEFALGELLEETLKTLALRAHRKGLELSCCLQPEIPARVIGDSGRLRQVLINLVGNAIKFTEQGEVTLRAELIEASAAGYQLRFSVIDTGIGIPADKQRLIFEAFSQADGSMTRRFGGTGLGLTISSKLVHLMGGQLQVESEPGRGSTFSFVANWGRPTGTAQPSHTEPAMNLDGLAVLVVDDNATNRRILEAKLKHWKARPTLVESGRDALAVLQQAAVVHEPFPLLLVDAMMPDMDGFSLIEELRKHSELDRPTVMMLSSADSLGDADRCRRLGISAYLVKPVRSEELFHSIVSVLRASARANIVRRAEPRTPETPSTPQGVAIAGLRILLAEDNPVNQRVALRLLAKHGHQVQAANNGQEALEALAAGAFDLVLMDVQMPVLDGFEATRAIRTEELHNGRHLPIVAMTAHAMKGDRERCLEAGMDDYVTKPIDSEQLIAAIERALGTSRGIPAAPREASAKPISAITIRPDAVDLPGLYARLENDAELLKELCELFVSSSAEQLQTIEQAVARRDCDAIERAAHNLMGAARNMAGAPCAQAAHALEMAAHNRQVDRADDLFAALAVELQHLSAALETAAQDAAPAPAV